MAIDIAENVKKGEKMINLIEETIQDIKEMGHSESDVRWVGSYDGVFGMSWEDFKSKFSRTTYDDGFGSQEIASDLVIVGDDWWLEREEYDGAEKWAYKKCPIACKKQLTFDKILGSWDTLKEIMLEEVD